MRPSSGLFFVHLIMTPNIMEWIRFTDSKSLLTANLTHSQWENQIKLIFISVYQYLHEPWHIHIKQVFPPCALLNPNMLPSHCHLEHFPGLNPVSANDCSCVGVKTSLGYHHQNIVALVIWDCNTLANHVLNLPPLLPFLATASMFGRPTSFGSFFTNTRHTNEKAAQIAPDTAKMVLQS